MGVVGCYGLDLYCDNGAAESVADPRYVKGGAKVQPGQHIFDEFPHQFTGEFGATCRKQARKRGWKLYPDGRALCPRCAKAGVRLPPAD